MRIGHISFRLAGTDGVSLETAKIVKVLSGMGHSNFYFAGELDEDSTDQGSAIIQGKYLATYAHFTDPEIKWITKNSFGTTTVHPNLFQKIEEIAICLEKDLRMFINKFQIELITVQNVFAIPLNLPLSLALFRVISESNIPVINHNHDFYWERDKYNLNCVPEILKQCFPPDLSNVRQVVINSIAKNDLFKKGIKSEIIPNIIDYDTPPSGIDSFNQDLRNELGVSSEELLFLQPTRVIPRKGIELSIDLISRLTDLKIKLLITHHAEYDTLDYLEVISNYAKLKKVDLLYLPDRFQPTRGINGNGNKIYSLWDAYVHSDFITYPSLYEGFGNALLEIIYFKKPFLVNRYKIFQTDIEPTGIKAVIIEEKITDSTVDEVKRLILNPELSQFYTQTNYKIAKQFFSFETAKITLQRIFASFEQ